MLAFSNDYYGMIFRATQSVELFCAYLLSLKIGIGSSLALYLAEYLGLDYVVSAGTITLLTLMTSKWETVKLAVCRLATFTMTILIAWMIFSHVKSVWIAYGVLLAIIVFIAEVFKWRATISVNG